MSYLSDLPQTIWTQGTGQQKILKSDLDALGRGLLESFELRRVPPLTWVDAAHVRVQASAALPARLLMTGVPDILHPGSFISGGLSDGRYRENTGDVSSSFWGTQQDLQWYAAYALAADAAATFTLKLMPWLRVKEATGGVISCGENETPATGRIYDFTVDQLAGGQVYVISGDSLGQFFSITANNETATETTITVSGSPTLAAGDWFLVLPPDTNFKWLGDAFSNADGDLAEFQQDGDTLRWADGLDITVGAAAAYEDIRVAPPLASEAFIVSVAAETSEQAVVGHPTLTLHRRETLSLGAVPVPVDLCSYYYDGGLVGPATIQAGGWRYRPGYLQ